MKRLLCLLIFVCLLLTSCNNVESGEKTKLSFSQSADISEIEDLDGHTVEIIGYMATLSPINGEYIYLMNLPYQSCPFCVPNSTQLANTLAVYAGNGVTFKYTEQAIKVTGRMELGQYTDDYGYEYNYRIVDANYEVVDLSEISEEYKLWQSIAADGIVADISSMFDYLMFLCQWTEYTASYQDESGNAGYYYLYPGDAENYLADDSAYGYAKFREDGYFDNLIARARSISDTQLEDLVNILEEANALAYYAYEQLTNGKYKYDDQMDKYALDENAYLYDEFYRIYGAFSEWLNKWEL